MDLGLIWYTIFIASAAFKILWRESARVFSIRFHSWVGGILYLVQYIA